MGATGMVRTRNRASLPSAFLAAFVLFSAPAAFADDLQERPVPNYDGLPEEGATAGEVVLWMPRIVVSPLYLVSEFIIRRPLGWFVTTLEEEKIPSAIVDFFTWDDRGAGFFPTFMFDFGLKPSVGLYFFWNNLFTEGHDFRFRVGTWGINWLQLIVSDTWELGDGWMLTFRGQAERRPDWIFAGIGPRSREDDRSRYSQDRFEGTAMLGANFWTSSNWRIWGGIRSNDFRDKTCCDDPSIRDSVDEGKFDLPPGFEEGYFVYRQGASVALDSRRPRPEPGGGVRFEAFAEHAFDLKEPEDLRWITYGGGLGAFWDPSGTNRILGVHVDAAFASELGSHEVPFSELPSLGGDRPLRGFLDRRLVGESAISATFEHRWPIWIFLDGSIQVEIGNVFREHLEDFDPGLLRASVGFGMRTAIARDNSLDLFFALGSPPLEDGLGVETVRVLMETKSGF